MTEHPQIEKVRLYVDEAGEVRFTAYAGNGEAIVVASEGYSDKVNALGAINGVFGDEVLIVDETEGDSEHTEG